MLGVTVLLWRRKQSALWLYAVLLLATMIWGVWEVGFDFWALTPRSDIPGLLRYLADPAVRLASPDCAIQRSRCGTGRGAADQRRYPDLGRL